MIETLKTLTSDFIFYLNKIDQKLNEGEKQTTNPDAKDKIKELKEAVNNLYIVAGEIKLLTNYTNDSFNFVDDNYYYGEFDY